MADELIDGFDAGVFCGHLRSRFPSFSEVRRPIRLADESSWESAEQLGVVKTLPGPGGANKPLLVVAAQMPEGAALTERSSRVRQFTFAKKTMDAALAHPAPGIDGILTQGLFIFHDDDGNFRLSLVYGKAEGTRLVWSSAKRLSFYVEAGAGNRTFRDRMALDWSTFDKLKDAFSVEKLTREFYNRLFAWYQTAMADNDLVFPNDIVKDKEIGEVKSEQIIRLITRLMFVWYIKQKRLVPDTLFAPAALRRILKSFNPLVGENYYRAILQNLFFATLNSEIGERDVAFDEGYPKNSNTHNVGNLYRYENEFQVEGATKKASKDAVLNAFKGIPFLNGGLFECLDKRFDEPKGATKYFDGFSRNGKKQARVPNRLFFDDAEGLIPLLSQYNFTVEENSPGDEEVALDPELLGKVFENLLGAYNPETKTAARNATGSFYTPREIGNYMVDESLVAHLRTHAPEVGEDILRDLMGEGETSELATPLRRKLVDALFHCRILDPACGSGAFPMGALHKMVHLLRRLDPDNALWNNVVLSETEKELKTAESLDAAEKSEHLKRVTDHFDQSVNTPDYARKLYLIEYCLYGVDIQPIAVQIAKLRAFITLVSDQEPDLNDPARNYSMLPLPNLETKFVAADTLIGLPELSRDVLDLCTGDIASLRSKLFDVRHEHFMARTYREKKKLRHADEKIRMNIKRTVRRGAQPNHELLRRFLKEREMVAQPKWERAGPLGQQPEMFSEFSTERSDDKNGFVDANEKRRRDLDRDIAREQRKETIPSTEIDSVADMLAAWDPYDQNQSAGFFDSDWMFNVKDGFDVVIGNPPYVQIQKLPAKTKTALAAQSYKTFSKTADLYCLFYERGLALSRSEGTLAYISSNKFFRAGYGKALRQFLNAQKALRIVIDFGELPVFEAGTDPCILLVSNRPPTGEPIRAAVVKETAGIQNVRWAVETIGFDLDPASLKAEGWTLQGGASAALLEKIRGAGQPLGEYVQGRFYRGVLTGLNDAFVIDRTTRDRLISEDPKSAELIRPWLRGKDIRRWYADYQDLYVINILSSANHPWPWSGQPAKRAEACFKKTYPALCRQLLAYRDKLVAREDQGHYFWELRSCAYHAEFEKPKIVYADIAKLMRASYDTEGVFCANTMYIMPTDSLYLLGFLNSSVFDWYARNTFQSLGDPWKGGRMRFIAQYMEHVPIPPATPDQRAAIESLVTRILSAKNADPDADTSDLETEIDRLVYRLYDITPEEIAIVDPASHGATQGKGSRKTEGKKARRRKKAALPKALDGWE